MRSIFTFLVLLLFVSLSIVLSQTSAQTTTPTATPKPRGNDTISGDFDSMLACMKCLSKAGLSQVPACSNLQDNPAISSVPVDKLDETQRQCYCGLVSSTEWTKSCSSGSTLQQQRCNATIVDTFLQGFAHVRPYVCTVTLSSQKSSAVGGLQAVVVEVSAWMTLAALMLQSFITFPTPNTPTDPPKSCFCPLTTSNTWISPCVSPNLCYAVSVNALFRQVAALGPYACPTSPLTSTLAPTVTTATASSPSDSYPNASAIHPHTRDPHPHRNRPTSKPSIHPINNHTSTNTPLSRPNSWLRTSIATHESPLRSPKLCLAPPPTLSTSTIGANAATLSKDLKTWYCAVNAAPVEWMQTSVGIISTFISLSPGSHTLLSLTRTESNQLQTTSASHTHTRTSANMHFSTSSVIALVTLSAVALAQNSTDPAVPQVCQDCLVSAGIAQVPTCTGDNAWPKGNLAVNTLTADQKNCYCQLSSNDAWVKTCSAPEQCGADIVSSFAQSLVAVKPAVCPTKSGAEALALVSTVAPGGIDFSHPTNNFTACIAPKNCTLAEASEVHYLRQVETTKAEISGSNADPLGPSDCAKISPPPREQRLPAEHLKCWEFLGKNETVYQGSTTVHQMV
ncbi:hypothetical protein F5H01DRAFT_374900 [Linnemannia elongata]|nr:hypothetical protein F5H01DRAFT_374900 [Linnemannia elongata]